MNKKIIYIGLVILVIVLVYIFVLRNKPVTSNESSKIILNNINLKDVPCTSSNLDQSILVENKKFICMLINDKYVWQEVDSNTDVTPTNEPHSDPHTFVSKKEYKDLKKNLNRLYVYENQRCSSRNLNTTAYIVGTNTKANCIKKGDSYFWTKSTIVDSNSPNPEDNNSLNPTPVDQNQNNTSVNDKSKYENSLLGQRCYYYEELKVVYDESIDTNFICVFNPDLNEYKWIIKN